MTSRPGDSDNASPADDATGAASADDRASSGHVVSARDRSDGGGSGDRSPAPSSPRSLRGHADFRRLWSAQAVSAFGSRITRTALPIIAVANLGVPENVVGWLMGLQLAPAVLLSLLAGGFVDRGSKRRILIAADLIRAVLVMSISLAWMFGVLDIIHVIVVGAVVGGASALDQITDVAYLPALIGKDQLVEGNAKLEVTEAVAEITGPASAGGLIWLLGAPLVVVVDGLAYLWSAMMLHRITATERPSSDPSTSFDSAGRQRSRVVHDLRVGLGAVFRHPHLRAIVIAHMVWAISGGFFISLYTPYCLRELDLSTATFGVVIAMGGIGSLAGALLSRTMTRWFGLGKTMVVACAMSLACGLFIPLAGGPWLGGSLVMTLALLFAHQLFSDGFAVAFLIQAVTLRQTVLPDRVLGRANAAIHTCTTGLLAISAVIAGQIGDSIGLRDGVWVGVLVGLLAPLALLPLLKLKEMPPPVAGAHPPSTSLVPGEASYQVTDCS